MGFKPAGYTGPAIPPGTAVGQVLYWNGTVWTTTAGSPASGDLLVWDGTSWVYSSAPIGPAAGSVLWLDASRAVGPVATLTDYSGSGNDFVQAVAGNQPTLNAVGSIGTTGLSTVTFDGINDYMTCDAPNPLAASMSGINVPWSWFGVLKTPLPATTEIILSLDKPVGAGRRVLYALNPGLYWFQQEDAGPSVTYPLQQQYQATLFAVVYDGISAQLYTHGDRVMSIGALVEVGIGSPNATTGTLVTMGCTRINAVPANFSSIEFGEQLLYATPLPAHERNRNLQYLSDKWGV